MKRPCKYRYDGNKNTYEPTSEEIREECLKIQANWSKRTKHNRIALDVARKKRVDIKIVPTPTDFIEYLKEVKS